MPDSDELAALFNDVAGIGVFNQQGLAQGPMPEEDEVVEDAPEPQLPESEEEEEQEEEETSPDVLAAQEETVEIDGQIIPISLIRAYTNFSQHLQSDPNLQQVITNYLQSGGQQAASPAAGDGGAGPRTPDAPSPAPQPVPTGFTIPEGIDQTDPGTQWLVTQLREQHEARSRQDQQLTLLTQAVQQQTMQSQQEQRRQNETHVNQAVTQFKEDKGLNDGELAHIRQVAANLNVLEPLTRGIDPFTGAPTSIDLTAAIYKAMDIALNSMPEYQERVQQRLTERTNGERTRKGKLSALSSPSGSGSRQPAPPKNETERRNAMISAVASAMNGNNE